MQNGHVPPVPTGPHGALQKQMGFGLERLVSMCSELREIATRNTPEGALQRMLEHLSSVTDASRELFLLRMKARLVEVAHVGSASLVHQFARDYRFGQTLGRGSFGHVFMGQRRADNLLVAVKVLDKAVVRKKGHVLLVQDERNLLAALRGHPFVLHFVCALHTRNNLLLLADLAAGGDLYHTIQKQRGCRFSEPAARFYIAQVVLAFDYLNGVRVMMRDLKLENVFLMADGYVKLGDLGFAKYLPANQRANTFVGTVEYLCPEIIKRQAYGFEADWWSLGVLAYEMLCGHTPFLCPTHDDSHFDIHCRGDHSQMEIMQRIQEATFRFAPDRLWRKLEKAKGFIRRLLQVVPQMRVGWQPRSCSPSAFYTPGQTRASSVAREPSQTSLPQKDNSLTSLPPQDNSLTSLPQNSPSSPACLLQNKKQKEKSSQKQKDKSQPPTSSSSVGLVRGSSTTRTPVRETHPAACYSVEQVRYDRWFEDAHFDWNALYERRMRLPEGATTPHRSESSARFIEDRYALSRQGVTLDEPPTDDEFVEF